MIRFLLYVLDSLIMLAKLALYVLAPLMALSTIVGLVKGDAEHFWLALRIFVSMCCVIAFIEWRKMNRRRRWLEEAAALHGLDKCPISKAQLCELFEYLNRPNPPACSNRLNETFHFLEGRGWKAERTIRWLHANGAKCDCEVIMNTSYHYGDEVGFYPGDYEEADSESSNPAGHAEQKSKLRHARYLI